MKLVPIFAALTLTTLGLAGCGAKDDATASTSASSASTSASSASTSASSASTSASSASASASNASSDTTASAVPSAGQSSEGSESAASALATASRSSTSKEYQPATEQGPAQNVPRPQQPEGMDIESTEGLEKFLNYWFAMRDYAIKTGDINTVFQMVESHYEGEYEFYKFVSETYKADGWIVQNGEDAYLQLHPDQVESNGEGLYAIKANFYQPSATAYDSAGNKTEELDVPDSRDKTFEFIARFQDGAWTLVNVEETK